ncbi:hypothetical protein ES703_58343 [subsurface metagenome]
MRDETGGEEIQLSDEMDKKRYSVTLTQRYVERLNRLIEEGVYLDQQSAIRDALRLLFRHHGMEPLYEKRVEEAEKVQE